MKSRFGRFILPLVVAASFILIWYALVTLSGSKILPKPNQVLSGMIELARRGVPGKYVVASLFRVSAGFLLALVVGIPLGLFLGWFARAFQAFNPIIQVLRPISP